jgi:hypothetical protein
VTGRYSRRMSKVEGSAVRKIHSAQCPSSSVSAKREALKSPCLAIQFFFSTPQRKRHFTRFRHSFFRPKVFMQELIGPDSRASRRGSWLHANNCPSVSAYGRCARATKSILALPENFNGRHQCQRASGHGSDGSLWRQQWCQPTIARHPKVEIPGFRRPDKCAGYFQTGNMGSSWLWRVCP